MVAEDDDTVKVCCNSREEDVDVDIDPIIVPVPDMMRLLERDEDWSMGPPPPLLRVDVVEDLEVAEEDATEDRCEAAYEEGSLLPDVDSSSASSSMPCLLPLLPRPPPALPSATGEREDMYMVDKRGCIVDVRRRRIITAAAADATMASSEEEEEEVEEEELEEEEALPARSLAPAGAAEIAAGAAGRKLVGAENATIADAMRGVGTPPAAANKWPAMPPLPPVLRGSRVLLSMTAEAVAPPRSCCPNAGILAATASAAAGTGGELKGGSGTAAAGLATRCGSPRLSPRSGALPLPCAADAAAAIAAASNRADGV